QASVSTDGLSADLSEALISINDALAYCDERQTFLTTQIARPFFVAAKEALDRFARSAKGRLIANIRPRLPSTEILSKRYPLQSVGREIRIAIPLRNDGPGKALNVSVSFISGSDKIAFQREDLVVGNISAGDFSVVLQSMVIEPVDELG